MIHRRQEQISVPSRTNVPLHPDALLDAQQLLLGHYGDLGKHEGIGAIRRSTPY